MIRKVRTAFFMHRLSGLGVFWKLFSRRSQTLCGAKRDCRRRRLRSPRGTCRPNGPNEAHLARMLTTVRFRGSTLAGDFSRQRISGRIKDGARQGQGSFGLGLCRVASASSAHQPPLGVRFTPPRGGSAHCASGRLQQAWTCPSRSWSHGTALHGLPERAPQRRSSDAENTCADAGRFASCQH
jgi:hypothetical protein